MALDALHLFLSPEDPMNAADLDLARRLAAVPRIWRAGMLTAGGRRLTDRGARSLPPIGAMPDLDDAATRGALLDVARERWGDSLLHVQWSWTWSAWYVYGAHHHLPGLIGGCPTEGAAIALAILAAPRTP